MLCFGIDDLDLYSRFFMLRIIIIIDLFFSAGYNLIQKLLFFCNEEAMKCKWLSDFEQSIQTIVNRFAFFLNLSHLCLHDQKTVDLQI